MGIVNIGSFATDDAPAIEAPIRKKLEAALWRHTHKDFRGSIDGVKNILILRSAGTCLVSIKDLSDEELLNKLPRKIMTLTETLGSESGYVQRSWTIEGIDFTEIVKAY